MGNSPQAYTGSSSCLNDPKPRTKGLLDLFIFVLQKRERVRYIIPLSLGIATGKPSCEFVGELFGMFVLPNIH